MKQLKDMTREELEELPMARVTFTYVRRKTEEKIGASIKLGNLLEVPFKKISKDDIALLCLEENYDQMPNNVTLVKPVMLTRGKVASGPQIIHGRDYFKVEVAIAPGVVLKAFLNDKQRLFVTRNYALERKFIPVEPKVSVTSG